MSKQTKQMKYLIDTLNDEQMIHKNHFETLLKENLLRLSPSAIKKMIDEPIVYFNEYVCGDFDDRETKAQKKGTLLHCLLFEEESFEQKYAVFPKDMNTPEGTALDVVTFIANNSENDSVALEDYKKEILDYMKEINYYQNLVDDKKNPSLTGNVKRLEKVLTPNNVKYFEYLMSSKGKEIINQNLYEEVLLKSEIIKSTNDFNKMSIVNEEAEDVTYELELETLHESSKLNLKCIIDSLKIDVSNKKAIITDLKSIGSTLSKTLKFDIEKYRYGIQAAVNYLCVKTLLGSERFLEMIPTANKFEIEFGFYFVDGNNTCKLVQVSKPTMEKWLSELDMYLNENVKYHLNNMEFSAPYEFLNNDTII